ncbi:MAG: class I SAM-dependent methyltransferase [Solirubrobacteraceae bacterium]
MSVSTPAAVWHDIECGGYSADLPVWRKLAARRSGPILDVGAGTGRVALDLARQGHQVVALDQDEELLAQLERRAVRAGSTLTPRTVVADARDFDLQHEFVLILAPMQIIQLLGGSGERTRFLQRAAAHLTPGGHVAIALTERFELYDADASAAQRLPLPDVREVSGTVYCSQPTAVRREGETIVLERRRETLAPGEDRLVEQDRVVLDRLTAGRLEREAGAAGLQPAGRVTIPATGDHVGSVVVILDG